jgi:hypothetical protein
MRLQYIKKLISEFYDGNTTIEQEKELYDFFTKDDIPAELKDDKDIFLACYESDDIKAPDYLEFKLNSIIDQLSENTGNNKSGYSEKIIKESINPEIKPPVHKNIFLNSPWTSFTTIAACAILIFAFTFFVFKRSDTQKYADTYKDPAKAYVETQKALALVAQNLNIGFEQMENASNKIDKSQKVLDKQIRKITK